MLKSTEHHPEFIDATKILDTLKASRAEEIETYLSSDGTDGDTDRIGSIASELKLEMNRLEGQLASLRVREADSAGKLERLRQKIDLVPQVEAERTALNRDYEITQRKYQELLSRKDSAELAQKADVSSEDVQFRVIDPPIAPQSASGPNRLLSYTIVLVLGFTAGLGLAFLISQLNPILIRGNQLTNLTSYPVLGTVSHLNRAHIKKIGRTRLFVFLLSSSLIVGIYGVLMGSEILQLDIYARIFS
jgi:polysaccharide chain length determinant protein (PEP-CTERM system associated)